MVLSVRVTVLPLVQEFDVGLIHHACLRPARSPMAVLCPARRGSDTWLKAFIAMAWPRSQSRSVLPRGSVIQQNITKLASVATCATAAQTVDPASDEVRLQETANFQLGGPERLTGANDPRHVPQKNGRRSDDGDILCHPIFMPTYLQEFDVANAEVGAERNPQKTEVICYVNDLDAVPLEWRIRDVQNIAKVSTATAGSITLGVAVGPRQYIADQLSAKAGAIRAIARTRPALPGPADGICPPPRKSGSWPHQPHPASAWPHKSFRNSWLQKCTTRLGTGLSNGSSRVSRRTG